MLFEFSADQIIGMIPTFKFTNRVLILEATILLIQEDLKTTQECAIEIKNLSSSYGMMAYPPDDNLDFCNVQALMWNLRVLVGIQDGSL